MGSAPSGLNGDKTRTSDDETLEEFFKCIICLESSQHKRMCKTCFKTVCSEHIQQWFGDREEQTCPHCRTISKLDEFIKIPWTAEIKKAGLRKWLLYKLGKTHQCQTDSARTPSHTVEANLPHSSDLHEADLSYEEIQIMHAMEMRLQDQRRLTEPTDDPFDTSHQEQNTFTDEEEVLEIASDIESQQEQDDMIFQEVIRERRGTLQETEHNNIFTNDSGNFSLRQSGDVTSGALFQTSSVTDDSYAHARPISPTQGSSASALSDFRLTLAIKDSEIKQLKARLQSHDFNNQSDVIDKFRTDLAAMIKRNQRSTEQAQEMKNMVTKNTAEQEKVIAQFKDLKHELADRDTQISSFDMRINQRNTQIVELQEQLNDKTMEMAKLERQVRQKSSQVTSLEEQLIEKTSQCAYQNARASTVEREMSARESEAQALHAELRDKQEAIEHMRDETERVQQIHEEQCRNYQKQIQERVENMSSNAREWEKQTDILRRDLSDKSHRLHETEQLLDRTQEEFKEKTGQFVEMLCELEKEADDSTRKIQQLEGAVKLCKDKIHSHKELYDKELASREEKEFKKRTGQFVEILCELEKEADDSTRKIQQLKGAFKLCKEKIHSNKELYDKELASREEKIKRLSRQHKITSHGLEVQTIERDDLERQVIETKTMLQQSTARIQDLENIQTQLQRLVRQKSSQVTSLEEQLIEKTSQCAHQAARASTVEREMSAREREAQALHAELRDKQEAIEHVRGETKRVQHIHEEQCRNYQKQIKRLSRQHKITSHDLEVQTVERDDIERQVIETKTMLKQSTARIQDLEGIQTQLQRQVSSLEHDLLTGNSQWLSGQKTMETKLKQACENLEERCCQCKQLSVALKSLKEEKKRMCGDIDILKNQLTDEQEGSDEMADRVVRLERDLRDMRLQLEHKIELVTDFENQLLQKNRDMEQQLQLVSDLDIEIKRLQDSHQEALAKISSLERNLDKARNETKAIDEMLEDMNDTLRRTKEELSHRKVESSNLQKQLDKRQEALEDRVALVAQLERTIKEQHSEMEMRIHKLDAKLNKQETEVKEKTKQISDQDDKLQQTTQELREKTLQHQKLEQLYHKQQMELKSKSAKLQEQDTESTNREPSRENHNNFSQINDRPFTGTRNSAWEPNKDLPILPQIKRTNSLNDISYQNEPKESTKREHSRVNQNNFLQRNDRPFTGTRNSPLESRKDFSILPPIIRTNSFNDKSYQNEPKESSKSEPFRKIHNNRSQRNDRPSTAPKNSILKPRKLLPRRPSSSINRINKLSDLPYQNRQILKTGEDDEGQFPRPVVGPFEGLRREKSQTWATRTRSKIDVIYSSIPGATLDSEKVSFRNQRRPYRQPYLQDNNQREHVSVTNESLTPSDNTTLHIRVLRSNTIY